MKQLMKLNARVFGESFLDQCDERIAAFYQFWKSKCVAGRIPARGDIDPAEMVLFLPGITMVNVAPVSQELTYRLVGTNEVMMRGNDPTGMRVKDNFLANDWSDVWSYYGHVINNKGIAYDNSDMPKPNGKIIGDETIFLPLSADGEIVDIVLLYSVQK